MRAKLAPFVAVVVLVTLVGCNDTKSAKMADKKATAKSVAATERSFAYDAASDDSSPAPPAAEAIALSDKAAEPHRVAIAEPTVAASKEAAPPEARFAGHDEVRLQTVVQGAANRSRYRAGTLTAGSFDDHARYSDYREYLSAAMQRDSDEVLPRLGLGERIVVRVVNEKNEPVNNATVVLHASAEQRDVATQRTISDGRAIFLSSLDHFASGGDLIARVAATGRRSEVENVPSHSPYSAKIERSASETTLMLPDAPRNLPQQLDLSLVIDTTGSMGDELEYLKAEIDAIAATVHKRFPNVDQRFSLVVYRDEGDEYVARKFDFTGSLSEFQASLSAQRASGGGDYPEAMHMALAQADSLDWRKDNAARVMFLVADAPPHRRFSGRAIEAVQNLRAKGVTIFPVAASGVQDEAEFVLRGTAFLTRGRYLFLTDHSGVGNPHARPNVPDFEVERLDQLMIRMIAWKLSGEETGMQEIIATSHGEDATQAVGIPPEQNDSIDNSTSATPSSGTPHRSASSGLLGAMIGELWRTDYWFRPNRYWLLGLIVVGIVILDRREVRRRRTMYQTTCGYHAR
jgi:hypothetical protein